LLVANKGDHTLGIIDPAASKQIAVVPENGVTGHEVITSPDCKTAYVPIYGDSGVGKPGTNGTNIMAIDIASRGVAGNGATWISQSVGRERPRPNSGASQNGEPATARSVGAGFAAGLGWPGRSLPMPIILLSRS
jgi:hypothetical protein